MRISDWSSDVCSSDLHYLRKVRRRGHPVQGAPRAQEPDTTSTAQALSSVETLNTVTVVGTVDDLQSLDFYAPNSSFVLNRDEKIGRSSCRESVCQYV